jgi:phosphoribosylformylglycinamidine cyclo-ligase
LRKPVTYKSAGVDIDAGNRTVELIRRAVRKTHNRSVLADIGLFGGLFEFDRKAWRKPVLVASTDGVGTKVAIAVAMRKFKTVGRDIVGHSVNDILVQGAKPLFFLDYVAGGKLVPGVVADIVSGMAAECRANGMALIGGETAEMPSTYRPGDYDIAGTIVGVVEKSRIIRGKGVRPGDVAIGLPSVSLHTNGYSLARRIVTGVCGLKYTDRVPELGGAIGDILLIPHKSYLHEVRPVLEKVDIKAMAHITGGGLIDNPPRVLPEGCRLVFRKGTWRVLPVFEWLVRKGNVPEEDAYRSFNMGIGMVLIVGPRQTDRALRLLRGRGARPTVIGEVRRGAKGVDIV